MATSSCRPARSATRPSTTTAGCPASSTTGCAWTWSATGASTSSIPVGDDDWLETLREGDRIRIGRWSAPFDVVRRYLVTGQVEAGRGRALAHDAIVNAMTQIRRWGTTGEVFGDQPEWAAARAAVAELMERYAARR